MKFQQNQPRPKGRFTAANITLTNWEQIASLVNSPRPVGYHEIVSSSQEQKISGVTRQVFIIDAPQRKSLR